MKEIEKKIADALCAQDEAYTRIIREYALVKNIPGNRALAEKYISDVKDITYEDINNAVLEVVKTQTANPESDDNSAEALIKKSNAIAIINAEINGAEDNELIGLLEQYRNTEYFNLLSTLIKPRMREMRNSGASGRVAADKLAMQFNKVSPVGAKYKVIMDDIHTLQYFNEASINLGVKQTNDGRFLIGNGQRRNIQFDLDNASAGFNPLGVNQEPLVTSESMGKYTVNSVKYQYNWETPDNR